MLSIRGHSVPQLTRRGPHLEVHGLHLVFEGMSLADQTQHRGHLLWVAEVFHHSVDGVHHPAGVVPQLGAALHLLWVLHVLELAEVLLGRREVDKEPGGAEEGEQGAINSDGRGIPLHKLMYHQSPTIKQGRYKRFSETSRPLATLPLFNTIPCIRDCGNLNICRYVEKGPGKRRWMYG